MKSTFQKLRGVGSELSRVQDNIADAINPLLKLPISDSNLLRDVALENGMNSVNHGLARELVGWVITRRNGGAVIYDTQASNPRPALTLQLSSDDDVTVDLLVF